MKSYTFTVVKDGVEVEHVGVADFSDGLELLRSWWEAGRVSCESILARDDLLGLAGGYGPVVAGFADGFECAFVSVV